MIFNLIRKVWLSLSTLINNYSEVVYISTSFTVLLQDYMWIIEKCSLQTLTVEPPVSSNHTLHYSWLRLKQTHTYK